MIKNEYNVIGVMSGTSLDGVDVIYTRLSFTTHWSFKIIHTETISYTNTWFKTLKNLVHLSLDDIKAIDVDYTTYLAGIIKGFIARHNIVNIDAVCSHGHTALHQPQHKLTYQIGNLPSLAHMLQQKVVCDFRVQDVALGGQGAPLVPIGDALLFSNYDYCLNLGGFANISNQYQTNRIAYDICPVNIVLNTYAEQLGYKYDNKGLLAASGSYIKTLGEALSALDFYKIKHPKSLGLEWVNKNIIPLIASNKTYRAEDVLHTFTKHIATEILRVVKENSKILITGGGAYNSYLISQLKAYKNLDIIIPNKDLLEFKEALIFAFLGVLKLRGEVNCLKSVTGALNDHSSGEIYNY